MPIENITSDVFEKLYLQLRTKEGRVYSDQQVLQLPLIDSLHQHYKEWRLRRQSAQKLIARLKKRNQQLDVLEIGCGNGWFSHSLAGISKSQVIGFDVNFTEIQQAARVFHDVSNLHFIYGNAASNLFKDKQFDVIVYAASIQYFPSLTEIIGQTLKLLKQNGEIHLIDSHFYKSTELSAARQRSLLYYESNGFPEMADWYYHHSLDHLRIYDYSILYDPNSLLNNFSKNKNPFYWICIKSGS